MDEGKLRVRLKTESQEALARISHRMGELRSALELHGISIDRVEMEVDPKLADRSDDPLALLGRQNDQPAAFVGSRERQPGGQEAREEHSGALLPAGAVGHEQTAGESQYTELRAERGLDVRA